MQGKKRSDALGFNRATLLLPAVDTELLCTIACDKKVLHYYYYFYNTSLSSQVRPLCVKPRVSLQYFDVSYSSNALTFHILQVSLCSWLGHSSQHRTLLPSSVIELLSCLLCDSHSCCTRKKKEEMRIERETKNSCAHTPSNSFLPKI